MSNKRVSKMRFKKRFKRYLPKKDSLVPFLVGLLLISLFGLYQTHKVRRLSFAGDIPITPYKIEHAGLLPSEIEFVRLKVHLPVSQTQIVNGIWQIQEKGASHLAQSAHPGQKGSVIIYGHNSREVFGPLLWAKVGDIVNVTTRNGQVHSYQIFEIAEVNPKDVKVLESDAGEVLVVYTCAGLADTKRLVVRAKPL